MRKISIDISEKMYAKIKKQSTEESLKQEKFVSMSCVILPVLEEKFGK